jgi:zinc transporter ZupT
MPTNNPNVGVAFALVTGAGMCTALGAAIVFSPTLVKYASRKTLAAALGLSAGVMSYVSFVNITEKSSNSFLDAGHSEEDAYMYSALSFFAGVIIMTVSTRLKKQIVHGILCLKSLIISASVLSCLQTAVSRQTRECLLTYFLSSLYLYLYLTTPTSIFILCNFL